MPPKRAAVPTNAFGGGPKALDKLTGRARTPEPEEEEAPQPEAAPPAPALPQTRSTVLQDNGNTVKPQSSKTASSLQSTGGEGADDSSTREKVTFYLRPDQVEKLDELVITYKRRTGRRTNRNALMRLLLDRVDIDLLLAER